MSKIQKPPIGYKYPAEAFYWHLPIEFCHDRPQKVKVMMFCSLGEKMDNINTESNSYREAVKCQEKSGFRDHVIIANLG